MTNEELLHLGPRAEDLYGAAKKSGIAAGDFLGPAEQAYLRTLEGRSFPADSLYFVGGYGEAERKVAVFVSDKAVLARKNAKTEVDWDSIDWEKDDWWQDVPDEKEPGEAQPDLADAGIAVLKLTVPKGAELPGHRDCLGSILALGLRRQALGDIAVTDDCVYLFVKETVASYLESSLTKVAKSNIRLQRCDLPADFSLPRAFERKDVIVASLRADALVAAITGCSRETAKHFVTVGNFNRNYLPMSDPEEKLCEGDVFSLRGTGRFRLERLAGTTQKGRLKVVLQKYV